jgi:dienelactone hydrolase
MGGTAPNGGFPNGGTTPNGGFPNGGAAGGSGAGGTAGSGGALPSGGTAGAGGAVPTGGAGGGSTECGKNLLPIPDDMTVRGPWDVGVRTVKAGRVTAEIMYPAEPGSTAGKPEAKYDLRDWLPSRERSKVPDANSPQVGPLGGHLFRDVPIDTAHGPYPVVVMIHGTASMRIASGTTNTHWASRGFVVIAADYPGLGLADQLSATLACGLPQSGSQDVIGDVKAQIAAIDAGTGDFAFLMGKADTKRLGIAGHSQGACLTATFTTLPNVQIILPLTGSTPASTSTTLKSIMWIAGINDTVIGFDQALIGNAVCPANPGPAVSNVAGYNASPGPPQVTKRLVGIQGGGHLVPTDLCQTNAQGRNAIAEAKQDGVCGIDQAAIIGLTPLFDCGTIKLEDGIAAVNYASTAALEETLQCTPRQKAFDDMKTKIPAITDFRHSP